MEEAAKNSGGRKLKENQANILKAKINKYFKRKMLLSQNKENWKLIIEFINEEVIVDLDKNSFGEVMVWFGKEAKTWLERFKKEWEKRKCM